MQTRNPYEQPDILLRETMQAIADKTNVPFDTVQKVLIEHFIIYIENVYNALGTDSENY